MLIVPLPAADHYQLPSSHGHDALQRVDINRGCGGIGLVRRRARQRGEHPRVDPQLAHRTGLVCRQPEKSGPASERLAWSSHLALVAAVAEGRCAKRSNHRGMVGPFLCVLWATYTHRHIGYGIMIYGESSYVLSKGSAPCPNE